MVQLKGIPIVAAQLRPTSATKRGFEFFTDRPGNDQSSFDLSEPDPRICQAMCSKRLWTIEQSTHAQNFQGLALLT
jgi:hypothetical protein